MFFVRWIASDFVGGEQIVRIARIVVVGLDRLRRHRFAKTPRPAHAYKPAVGIDPLVEIRDNPRLIDVCFGLYNLLKAHISWIEKSAHSSLLAHLVGQRSRPTVQMTIIAHCWGNGEGMDAWRRGRQFPLAQFLTSAVGRCPFPFRRDNSHYEKLDGVERCIDGEIPFEIPENWGWVRFGNISSYAETKQKVNAANADPAIWGLDLEDIEKGGKLIVRKTVGERKAIGDKTVFAKGDILYSKLRPYLLKILIAHDDGICTPEIVPFRVYGGINPNYIVNYLKSPCVDNLINSITYGVKMPRVGTETMTSLLVPIPPLNEQHRIVQRIEELLPLIKGL